MPFGRVKYDRSRGQIPLDKLGKKQSKEQTKVGGTMDGRNQRTDQESICLKNKLPKRTIGTYVQLQFKPGNTVGKKTRKRARYSLFRIKASEAI